MKCKVEACTNTLSRAKHGYCRKHRHLGFARRPFWSPEAREAWKSKPENVERHKQSKKDWAKNNVQKKRQADREYQKRKRQAQALQAVEALRPGWVEKKKTVRKGYRTGYVGKLNLSRI